MDIKHTADKLVMDHVTWAVGAGLVPIPVVDIAAVTAVQLDMIKGLCNLYGQDYSETQGKAWITALASTTIMRVAADSIAKSVPFVGTFIGGITMSALSGGSTYAIGQTLIGHFEQGGTLENFNLDSLKNSYDQHFKKGKKVADDLSKEKEIEVENEEPDEDAIEKLERLANLKAKGIISEEEFEKKKEELLAQL